MNVVVLKGNSKYELYCEITDTVDTFNTMRELEPFYICFHSKGCLVMRSFGASRGCIKYNDDGIITEVRIYDESINFGKGGIFKHEDKDKINESLNKYVGYRFF